MCIRDRPKASVFIRRHRRKLINAVASCTGQRKYDIDKLIRKLVRRCDALHLVCPGETESLAIDLAAFVTTVIIDVRRFYKDWENE